MNDDAGVCAPDLGQPAEKLAQQNNSAPTRGQPELDRIRAFGVDHMRDLPCVLTPPDVPGLDVQDTCRMRELNRPSAS
jgi:hypothetical protein